MSDVFREMREEKRLEKANRYANAVDYLDKHAFVYTVPTAGALKFQCRAKRTIMVYPASKKVFHVNRLFYYRSEEHLGDYLIDKGVNRKFTITIKEVI